MSSLLRKASNIFNSTDCTPGPRPLDPSNNDNDSDPDPAANLNDTSNYAIPRNILAFRTITTLLAKIQQDTPITYSDALDRRDISPEHKQELKISNALANVANTDTDIVALVTRFSSFSDALDVLVCGNLDGDRDHDQPGKPVPPSKSSIWEIIFTRNPDNSKLPMKNLLPTYPVQGPTISAVGKPAGVKSDDAKELIRYIHEDW